MKDEIVLNVPFKEKDEVKMLGARWDPGIKKWYIPSGQNPRPFMRWMKKNQMEDPTNVEHKNNMAKHQET